MTGLTVDRRIKMALIAIAFEVIAFPRLAGVTLHTDSIISATIVVPEERMGMIKGIPFDDRTLC